MKDFTLLKFSVKQNRLCIIMKFLQPQEEVLEVWFIYWISVLAQ